MGRLVWIAISIPTCKYVLYLRDWSILCVFVAGFDLRMNQQHVVSSHFLCVPDTGSHNVVYSPHDTKDNWADIMGWWSLFLGSLTYLLLLVQTYAEDLLEMPQLHKRSNSLGSADYREVSLMKMIRLMESIFPCVYRSCARTTTARDTILWLLFRAVGSRFSCRLCSDCRHRLWVWGLYQCRVWGRTWGAASRAWTRKLRPSCSAVEKWKAE